MTFKGTIIEESLEDKRVLQELKITNTEIEPVKDIHKTPWLRRWTLLTIEIEENKAMEIAGKISRSLDSKHEWYADFKNKDRHIIIFRNKVFDINRTKENYEKVRIYGISLGIPDYQLDFSPEIK